MWCKKCDGCRRLNIPKNTQLNFGFNFHHFTITKIKKIKRKYQNQKREKQNRYRVHRIFEREIEGKFN